MALETAGIELVAKGYRQYAQQLREVDRLQREVFKQPAGANQAHLQAAQAARQHEQEVKRVQSAYKLLGAAILAALTGRAAREAWQAMGMAFDFDRQSRQLEAFAASSGQSYDAILGAVQDASRGMIDNGRLVSTTLQAMRLEVAKTPEQLKEFYTLGIALRSSGTSAAEAMSDLTAALGRKSLMKMDNFSVSMDRVRREMDRVAQTRFGKQTWEDLDEGVKSAEFMHIALQLLRQDYEAMGGASNDVVNQVEVINSELEDTKLVAGVALAAAFDPMLGKLDSALVLIQKIMRDASAGAAALQVLFKNMNPAELLSMLTPLGAVSAFQKTLISGATGQEKNLWKQMQDAALEAWDKVDKAIMEGAHAADSANETIAEQTQEFKDLSGVMDQAAQIARSYSRAVEDALRRQERQARRLQEQQAKELVKLQQDTQKDLVKAEKDATKDRLKLEKDRAKDIKKQQDDLFKELKRAQERYDLDRLQSRRRFQLSDKRLRAEGDILALQQLREDYALSEQEAAENHALEGKQQKEAGRDQLQEQAAAAKEQMDELQNDLAERKQELFDSYNEELATLQEKHAEQREEQAKSLAEQLEDLQINRRRQLEDLGYNLAAQEDMNAESAKKVADILQDFYGEEGISSQIMTGFWDRQNSNAANFARLMNSALTAAPEVSPSTLSMRTGRIPRRGMATGYNGIVQGPAQLFVEPGITEFVYAQPLRGGSSSLNVGGGATFNINAPPGTDQAIIEQTMDRMADEFEIAVRRLVRRG